MIFIFITDGRQIDVLRCDLKQTQRSAYAIGTYKNISTQIKSFLLFCEYFHVKSIPVSIDDLCLYIQFLSRSMKSVQSIRNYVNGVKYLHVFSDAEFPNLADIQIKLTLRGLSKILFHTPKQASPITPEILVKIWRVLDFESPLHATIISRYHNSLLVTTTLLK